MTSFRTSSVAALVLLLAIWAAPAEAQGPAVTSANVTGAQLIVVGDRLTGAFRVTIGPFEVGNLVVSDGGTMLTGTVGGTLAPGSHLLTITTNSATPTALCSSVQPGPDWVCVAGGWVPPGHPQATAPTGPSWASTLFVVAVGNAVGAGPAGPVGATGATGPVGPAGPQGPVGVAGPTGLDGAIGPQGVQGNPGPQGAQGSPGIQGTPGTPAVTEFADFYALMPPNGPATVAVGGVVEFPVNGPTNGTITRLNPSAFNIPNIGVYSVAFLVSVDEPAQLGLALDGVALPSTIVGRATGTSQLVGTVLIATVSPNSVLTLLNLSNIALTLTPFAGGSNPVSAHLVIQRLQ